MINILKYKLTQPKPLDGILVILLIVALYFGIVSFGRQKQTYYVDLIPAHNSYNDEPFTPTHWSIEAIEVGSASYDASGAKIAEVVEVNAVDAGHLRKRVKIKLKVFGLLDKRTNQFRINDTELKIGSQFNLTLSNTNFNGLVTYIGPDQNPPHYMQKQAQLRLLVRELPNWHAASINSSFTITNDEQMELFRITDVDIRPAEKTGYTATGQITTATDPLYKDVYLEATAIVDCYHDNCYFLDVYPLKISQPWYLYTSQNQLNDAKVIEVISLEPLPQE
jgi:hypothetical protein